MPDKIIEEILNQFGLMGLGAIIFTFLIAQYPKAVDFFNQISQVSNAKLRNLRESLDNPHINVEVRKQLETVLNELTFKKITGFHLTANDIEKANLIFELLEGKVLMADICRGINYISISSDNKIFTNFLDKSTVNTIMMFGGLMIILTLFLGYISIKDNDYYRVATNFNLITVASNLIMFLTTIYSLMSCYKTYLTGKSIAKIESAII